jgi:hypothetical protein
MTASPPRSGHACRVAGRGESGGQPRAACRLGGAALPAAVGFAIPAEVTTRRAAAGRARPWSPSGISGQPPRPSVLEPDTACAEASRLAAQPREKTFATPSLRLEPGSRAYLVGRRIHQPTIADVDRRHGLIAVGNTADRRGRSCVLPDVDLAKRKPTPAQLAAQPEAVRAARTSVEDNLEGHAQNRRTSRSFHLGLAPSSERAAAITSPRRTRTRILRVERGRCRMHPLVFQSE